jgi:hypothetical protein
MAPGSGTAVSTTDERTITLPRAQRDDESFTATWSAGAAHALEQAIADASA